jgi:site-specific DNA recombinase
MPKKVISPKTEAKRVAIYCRVSTHDQGRGDFSSLNSQESILRKYCQDKGWTVYDVYSDTKSGASLERAELNRLLVDAAGQKFDVIAITKLDRISRSVKDFLELDTRLQALGIDIVVATQNIDTTNPSGKMMRNILLSFAEFERDMIAERTREKLYSQAQKGYWGGGNVPLGYDVKDKKLVINQQEADLVRRIFTDYLGMPSAGKIATKLNQEGYRAKRRISKSGNTRDGGIFTKDTIKRILRNPIYTGLIQYKKEQFQGLHERIVDDQLFEKIQQRLAESATDPRATYEDSELALLGIISCGHCGSQLTTSSTTKSDTGKKYYYYKCSRAFHTTKAHCPSKDLKADEIELFIRKLVSHISSDSKFFDAIVKQMQFNTTDEYKQLQAKRADLAANRGRFKQAIDNLLNQMEHDARLTTSTALTDRLKDLETSKTDVDTELQKIGLEISRMGRQQLRKEDLQDVFKSYNEVYDRLPTPIRRRVNHLIFKDIKSNLRRGETTGNLMITMRGDGEISVDWKKITELTDGSCNWSGWLPAKPEASKCLTLKLAVSVRNIARSEKAIILSPDRIRDYLRISDATAVRLTKLFSLPKEREPLHIQARLDYPSLAMRYNELINEGCFKNQAHLARYLGVSRAWITKVLKRLPRN